jgi:hypothetical protein
MALQGALAASNDPDDVGKFIHDDAENKAFAIALRKMQRYQHCYPTVTEQQVEWMCSTTLGDFCEGKTSDHYMGLSTSVIQGLGYIHEDGTLAMDHNVLSMVWEMHETLPIAIHLCAVLEQLYLRFCFQKGKSFKESDSTQNDFLSVLVHVVDRHPAKEGDESLQEMLRIEASEDGKLNEDLKQMWLETEVTLRNQKGVIDAMDIPQYEKDKMLFDMPPAAEEGGVGPALDKGMYEMIISKQKGFHESQSTERRNELKSRIVALGQICQIAHNNLQQPHGKYSELEVHFRRMFSNIKYSVSDMMNQLTDQEDLTEI